MPQSQTDCCNSALQKLGAGSILSLTDNSAEARACALAFESGRRSELRLRRWNFAKKRAVLAPDSAAPEFDFKYRFTLPSDCLRVLRPNDPWLDWVIEGRKLLSNTSNVLNLIYIADITDAAVWDSAFYSVMSSRIALDVCDKLTNSNSKKQLLQADYKDAVTQAALANAFETLPAEAPEDDWLVARMA